MVPFLSDYDDGGFERGTLEIHNGGYIHERGVDVEEDARYATKNSTKPSPMVTGIAVPSSFVNPAFDKDDIDDEDLESSMAKPTATRPGTLRKFLSSISITLSNTEHKVFEM